MSKNNNKDTSLMKPSMPAVERLDQGLSTKLTASRGEVAQSGRAKTVAENEAAILNEREKAAIHIAKIGENLASWASSVATIEKTVDEAKIDKAQRGRKLKDTENAAFLDDLHRDKNNAIEALKIDDDLRTAEANSEYVRLELEDRLLKKRMEVEQTREKVGRVTNARPGLPDPLAEAMRQQEAEVRFIVRDASEGMVKTDPRQVYHAYAACHYIAARLRGVAHETAIADLFTLVLERMRFQPILLDEAMDYQRRYETLKGVARAREADERTAAQAAQEREASIMVERLRKEAEEAKARMAEANRSIFGEEKYDPRA
jgi:hypothetical protein